jgi:hypothetical protein
MKKKQKSNLVKQQRTGREWLQDLIVALIVIIVVGGMILYAHFDIVRIVNG